MRSLFLLFTVLYLLLLSNAHSQKLKKYNVDQTNGLTVSGVSAGGAMAIQLHLAYSKTFTGMAAFAGPPYWCAQGDVAIALSACMEFPELIDLNVLHDAVWAAYEVDSIDNPSYLKNDRVWFFSGTNDTVVNHKVVLKSSEFYKKYIPDDRNFFVGSIAAEHAWITNNFGNACGYLGKPWINNCGFDGSGSFLRHLHPEEKLNPAGVNNASNLFTFEQGYYTPLDVYPDAISFAKYGYVYVPWPCQQGASPCKLHVVLHGCKQGYGNLGSTFIIHNGLNEWAETNNFIVLYPQVAISELVPYNPQGCFDWWGYTGPAYATQDGPQMITISNMLDALGAKP
jgi:hypothetical protein